MATRSPMQSVFQVLAVAVLMGALVGCVSLGAPVSGVQTDAYQGVYDDLDELLRQLTGGEKTLLAIEARFCLRRAYDDRRRAGRNSGLDSALLISAGVAGGYGASVGAATAAMNDTSAKKNLQISGVATVAASAAILGLRTSLALYDLARTQRIAAANSVDAALDIITAYALADDPKDVKEDGFHTCRDEDINVARAFPGAKNQEALEKSVAKAAEETKEASAQVVKSEAEVASVRTELTKKGAERTTNKAAGAQETLQKQVKELQEKLTAAQAELQQKKLLAAKAEVEEWSLRVQAASSRLHRMLYFGTKEDVDQARQDLEAASKNRKQASRRMRDLQKSIEQDEEKPAEESEEDTKQPAKPSKPSTKSRGAG